MDGNSPSRLIVGLTGATGTILGVRLLQALQAAGVESHLVMSKWAIRTLVYETEYSAADVERLATHSYRAHDQGAAISSGSFLTRGMVVCPCSMRTLASIAHGVGDQLVHRAADVILKERRKLVLVVREAPLHDIHLENMLKLSRTGAIIFPSVPAFYNHPKTIDDLVDQSVLRIMDQFNLHLSSDDRWSGEMTVSTKRPPQASKSRK